MAVSPSFVGTPRTTMATCTSAEFLLRTVFTAGASGSAIKSLMACCFADQQLYATFTLVSNGISFWVATIPLRVTALADMAQGQLQPAVNLLDPAYFHMLKDDLPYLELGELETIKVSVGTNTGAPPEPGELVYVRAVGADY